MVNRLKVNTILKKLESYYLKLKEFMPITEEKLKDFKEEYAVAFLVEQIVNECINLGNHIISERDFELPSSYKDIFKILAKEGVIQKEIVDDLVELVDIRNKIAHVYGYVTKKDLIMACEKIKVVEKFVKGIIKYLNLNFNEKEENS